MARLPLESCGEQFRCGDIFRCGDGERLVIGTVENCGREGAGRSAPCCFCRAPAPTLSGAAGAVDVPSRGACLEGWDACDRPLSTSACGVATPWGGHGPRRLPRPGLCRRIGVRIGLDNPGW